MDPLSVTAGAASILVTAIRIANKQRNTLTKNYGWDIGILVSLLLRDTPNRNERIEKDVLNGDDEEALAFRQSITDECNMTAVAGAIIAQVALTALSLPNLSSAHWIARALFLIAVSSGCLSVYYACVLQRIIGKLYRPDKIRTWLKSPPSSSDGIEVVTASLPAVFIISAPFTAVKVSIFAFLTGLAIYQGFVWTRSLDTSAGPQDSRDIFIAYIAVTGAFLFFFSVTFSAKNIESLLRLRGLLLGSEPQWEQRPPDRQRQANTTDGVSDPPQRLHSLDPVHPRDSADRVVLADLAGRLVAAAHAHELCAEADRLVALEYGKVSQTTAQGNL